MRRCISLLTLGLSLPMVACQSTQTPPPAPPIEAPTPGLSVEAITMGLCGGTLGCQLEQVEDLGPAKDGGSLQVFEASVANPETSDEMVFECRPHRRLFYVVKQRPEPGGHSQLLLDLCNTGYGASGIGEDTVTYEPGRLIHQQVGGSASRWTTTRVLELDPVALAIETIESYHGMMPIHDLSTMDWRTLQGEVSSYQTPCGPDGSPVVSDDDEIIPDFNAAYRPIPLLEGQNIDWATTALGQCAARVGSDESSGYVIHGTPGSAEDASMKVLLSDANTLVVEILDDKFVGEGKSWLYEDHLEIWRGQVGEDGYGCYNTGSEVLHQWGITLDTGEVFPAYGKPTHSPTVERISFKSGDKEGVRLILTFPEGQGEGETGVTVVYSDSDDGKTQERLIATSHFKFGDAHSLGYSQVVDTKRARCLIKGGALNVELVPIPHNGDTAPALE